MKCEICGKDTYAPQTISVEGSTMRVCEHCTRHGVVMSSHGGRSRRPRYKKLEEALDVVEEYSKLIHDNRERKGMTQEELAKRINEPESVIKRLESGKMEPSERLARKLEKILHVSLLEKTEKQNIVSKEESSDEITLGDLAKVKRRHS